MFEGELVIGGVKLLLKLTDDDSEHWISGGPEPLDGR